VELRVPESALVLLIGPSGSGKSRFARRHFRATEVLSSDACRAMICDDENDQSVTRQAFELLHFILRRRLRAGRLTVVDATNVQAMAREPLLRIASRHRCPAVAIVFDLPESLCRERDRQRRGRRVGPEVIRKQMAEMHAGLAALGNEGFDHVFRLASAEDVAAATVVRGAP